jgi:endonuclease YncB( thermonuclease family)
MFGRRKTNDGFEWHKYIRTTVRLRREQRRERMLQARHAAAQQASAAGAAMALGSRAAGAAAVDGARAALGAAWLVVQAVGALVVAALVVAGQRLAVWTQPLVAALARPNIGGPIALAGAIALGTGIGRYRGTGLDGEAAITLGIGIALFVAALPLLSSLTGLRMPSLAKLGISPRSGLAAVAVAAIAIGLAWFATGGRAPFADLAGQLPLIGGAKPLQGRGEALAGDLVRVAGTTVRLAGIEAPERQQVCGEGSRRQRCGAAAQAALGRLVNGRTLSCTLSGGDAAGRPLASCTRGPLDINAELVRQGHVFAEGGLFASYTGLEREARAAKAGMWAAGEAERPSAYRAKVWEEAKRRAPDGCPIKGLVTGRERIYVLPWSPDYERGRIQKARGERWFCSEEEAMAAGWKPATRG